eukprot:ctg_2505.g534
MLRLRRPSAEGVDASEKTGERDLSDRTTRPSRTWSDLAAAAVSAVAGSESPTARQGEAAKTTESAFGGNPVRVSERPASATSAPAGVVPPPPPPPPPPPAPLPATTPRVPQEATPPSNRARMDDDKHQDTPPPIPRDARPSTSSSTSTSWGGRLTSRVRGWLQRGKQANLGRDNQFYYDTARGQWVCRDDDDGGDDDDEADANARRPPPPPDDTQLRRPPPNGTVVSGREEADASRNAVSASRPPAGASSDNKFYSIGPRVSARSRYVDPFAARNADGDVGGNAHQRPLPLPPRPPPLRAPSTLDASSSSVAAVHAPGESSSPHRA